MKKYFFNEDSEMAYSESYFQDMMKIEQLNEFTVIEAIKVKSSDVDFIWCKFHYEVGEKGECGKDCKQYSPRNGKSGMCKNQGILFEHGKKVTLNLKP